MVFENKCGLGGAGAVAGGETVAAPSHTTAARLGVVYSHDAPRSDDPDKSAGRTSDGSISSLKYAEASAHLGTPSGDVTRLDFHHRLEDFLGRRPVRWLLGWLSKSRLGGKTIIEEAIESYANPAAPGSHRFRYWLAHRLIDWIKGETTAEAFRTRVGQHRSTIRGLVATARSVAEFGLTLPQRFSTPLFAVWNFTNACNLACQHCYQDAAHRGLADELTLDEKLDVIDQAGAAYVAMIAFAGGEPTISPHLLPALKRCQHYGIHTSVATNGTTMTPRLAAGLAEAGVKYVEMSLDSVDPAKHDRFRGQPGMWERTVRGMKTVVATPGLRLGIAMCVHQGNYDEVERMLQFAVDVGAGCIAHFNFIPVGRGLNMTAGDLTPAQREALLQTLNRWMQSGKIGVLSTAPQLGRVCLAHSPIDTGKMSTSHAGSSSGIKTRVVAKYLGGCGAGRTYVCIEPNGDVTPCVYMPQRVLGNVRKAGLVDIYRNNEHVELLNDRDHRLGHCEVCHFKHYCGGCRARADAYYGQVHAADPGCVFNDKHWHKLVADGIVSSAG